MRKLHPSTLALQVQVGRNGVFSFAVVLTLSFPLCVNFGGHMLEMAVSLDERSLGPESP